LKKLVEVEWSNVARPKKSTADIARPPQPAPFLTPKRLLWPSIALAVLIFYGTPLFDDRATIQWDAVDVHYSAQKYFEQSLRTTGLPRWTPFEYSGMPFLADPQTAAWYPLHWPFFLIGITPRALEWELALHAFLAFAGVYLLARRLYGNSPAALAAALFYAGGGFFAGHSSHLGMFESAALLPWLLWSALVAIETGAPREMLLTGAIAGLLVLAGHFQTALYSFLALALFISALFLIARRGPWIRYLTVMASAVAIGFLIGAIQILPGLELAAQSVRAGANYHADTNSPLHFGALATLFYPNFYGAVSGEYKGPTDITQFYLYQGLLLVPLALAGFARRKAVAIPLALIAPALWYSLGPGTGLYSVLTLLPGFKSVRAPIHIWFVVALGLSLAAASGCLWIAERFRRPWLIGAILVFSVADVWYWNMSANPLAYGRTSYAEAYGNAYDNYQNHLAGIKQRPFYRIWAPNPSSAFGPLNSSLESRTEVTYGYNPLELARYAEYLRAAEQNPLLLNGLAVTHKIDVARGALVENPDALARVSAPARVTFVSSAEAARAMLGALDPAQSAVVEAPARELSPAGARIQIVNYEDDFYRVRYSAPSPCLLRIAVPYYPGWIAAVDGNDTQVVPVDYALSGVIVPAGNHELTFRYRSNWFRLGATLSSLTALACLSAFIAGRTTRM
jgi:hypothetical protein